MQRTRLSLPCRTTQGCRISGHPKSRYAPPRHRPPSDVPCFTPSPSAHPYPLRPPGSHTHRTRTAILHVTPQWWSGPSRPELPPPWLGLPLHLHAPAAAKACCRGRFTLCSCTVRPHVSRACCCGCRARVLPVADKPCSSVSVFGHREARPARHALWQCLLHIATHPEKSKGRAMQPC